MENMVNAAFWQGKRVLVTGHTGFKGGWLCLWLQSMGAQVTGFSLPPTSMPNLFDVAQVADGMASVIGDLRDRDSVQSLFALHRPEIVFHLAAQSLVGASYEDPVGTYASNVMGTVHVLDAARSCSCVRAVVNITSDKCYENREWCWPYRENDPLGGYDPYSSSKACAELVTAAYRRSFLAKAGCALASARAGNVIGGGDWAVSRLVPDLMRAVRDRQSVSLRHPNAVRPWQHVLDALHGYMLLAERLWKDGGCYGEPWNFGPAQEDMKPVVWLAEKLLALRGQMDFLVREEGDSFHEAGILKLDSSMARMRLGWSPRLSLEQALAWVAEWYAAFDAGGNMRALSEKQLSRYQEGGGAHDCPLLSFLFRTIEAYIR